ncbi:2,3-bisphosphoglycerate-dependent phosphoglycerate mutase [Limnoraphis robusta Tam1]|uniref:2,3-bisphosphoglycerate-dependent phosphoglycerate mutase n=1 Tax=Limnoraphis robusta CCNP1315 TaxID=3110306 RepID=A0ABU5TYW4_9CYAN|nr:2,3-bisphosphoglycerate-dependent phosphoglycerate mutase [Limnoraphis robusta]MEA5496979.1 2,3-bisphosphoglycerate-dependent phosphoglycerate mutase [Limnoraphis robusta BA-68 BA1]MEA5519103.1 2,3-bisphosphoglycerate-dependent phosphoglycerate mutase [Limnoraphis robusta CCNP1315]MEA5541157.1 2,3-bisphosphoglycerate-dependent phosphoglycerate mutase [Limnoraphis robusta Tam1]MEA5548832.1 2,3-bisphosphoglycerate-dependent phosphoglycerate mutase [Limnoraphis robusta CCNP1324]
MAQLILLRHGQSLWNASNRFTGWVDVPLSERGRAEATIASCKLRNYRVQVCFTSMLMRALETAVICLTECDEICGGKIPIIKHNADDPQWQGWDQYGGNVNDELPIIPSAALDERYYGNLQGLNKAETAEKYGEDQVYLWRRSFSERPPGGESLEDTMNRTVPFFKDRILAHIKQGENVLVSAHGNSLRSILMYLDHLSPEDVPQLELKTGVPIVYEIDAKGEVQSKVILND